MGIYQNKWGKMGRKPERMGKYGNKMASSKSLGLYSVMCLTGFCHPQQIFPVLGPSCYARPGPSIFITSLNILSNLSYGSPFAILVIRSNRGLNFIPFLLFTEAVGLSLAILRAKK